MILDTLATMARASNSEQTEALRVGNDKSAYAAIKVDEAIAQQYQISSTLFLLLIKNYAISGAQP